MVLLQKERYSKLILIWLVLIFPLPAVAQGDQEARLLLREVNARFGKVKDYQADAVIDTRISFLKILPQRAKVYYRQPDQFRVKAQGIAILPKQSFDQLFTLIAKENAYFPIITGDEKIGSYSSKIINVIPLADTSDLVLAKLWIDPERDLIVKSQLTTRSNGTVLVDYTYGAHASYALPDKVSFTIEVKKFKIPKAVSADINSTSVKPSDAKDPKTGTILIALSNYVINKGIPVGIFK